MHWGWLGGHLTSDPIRGDIVVMTKQLTFKQERFAHLVGADGEPLAEAYRKVYGGAGNMKPETVHRKAIELSQVGMVAARIAHWRGIREAHAVQNLSIDVKRLAEIYGAIALTDPNELISQRVGACRHCWGAGGLYQWKELEYIEAVAKWERSEAKRTKGPAEPMPEPLGGFGYRFTADPNPECSHCEGEGITRIVPMDTTKLSLGARHLYRGVSYTKEGPKIKFADQDAALERIGRMLGAFDDKLRVQLDAKIASFKLTTSDPREAGQAYAAMLDASVNPS